MNLIEAAQMALDCIEAAIKAGDWKVDGACDPDFVFVALRAALATEQEPPCKTGSQCVGNKCEWCAVQEREWQGLTDEEQMQVALSCGAMSADWLDFARAIEAKLKEKNS